VSSLFSWEEEKYLIVHWEGTELLGVTRERVREELGVVRFVQQSEIASAVRELLVESEIFLPPAEERAISSTAVEWMNIQVHQWASQRGFPEICQAILEAHLTGSQLLTLSPDDFCLMGLSALRVVDMRISVRRLVACQSKQMLESYFTKTATTKKTISSPSLFDGAVESWLSELNLSGTNQSTSPRNRSDSEGERTVSVNLIRRGCLTLGMLNCSKDGAKWKMRWIMINSETQSSSKCSQLTPTAHRVSRAQTS
jgi:hypothetical protein